MSNLKSRKITAVLIAVSAVLFSACGNVPDTENSSEIQVSAQDESKETDDDVSETESELSDNDLGYNGLGLYFKVTSNEMDSEQIGLSVYLDKKNADDKLKETQKAVTKFLEKYNTKERKENDQCVSADVSKDASDKLMICFNLGNADASAFDEMLASLNEVKGIKEVIINEGAYSTKDLDSYDVMGFDRLGLYFETQTDGIDGENFIFSVYLEEKNADEKLAEIEKAVGDFHNEYSNDERCAYVDISKETDDKISIFLDMGNADDEAVSGTLLSLNDVEGIRKVIVNEGMEDMF